MNNTLFFYNYLNFTQILSSSSSRLVSIYSQFSPTRICAGDRVKKFENKLHLSQAHQEELAQYLANKIAEIPLEEFYEGLMETDFYSLQLILDIYAEYGIYKYSPEIKRIRDKNPPSLTNYDKKRLALTLIDVVMPSGDR